MSLEELHERLIALAKRRVRAGEITERGLARACGLSQPHMHNVLKRIRSLSSDSADRLMQALQVNITDFLWSASDESGMEVRAVPLLQRRLGPGTDTDLSQNQGSIPLPAGLVRELVEPVAARLAPDLVLPRMVQANDLVLLDRNPAVRSSAPGAGLWVVADEGGHRVRYLRTGGSLLYIVTEATLAEPRNWRAVSLVNREILEVVVARIVWMSREFSDSGEA